jgi:hypothetical protein
MVHGGPCRSMGGPAAASAIIHNVGLHSTVQSLDFCCQRSPKRLINEVVFEVISHWLSTICMESTSYRVPIASTTSVTRATSAAAWLQQNEKSSSAVCYLMMLIELVRGCTEMSDKCNPIANNEKNKSEGAYRSVCVKSVTPISRFRLMYIVYRVIRLSTVYARKSTVSCQKTLRIAEAQGIRLI